MTLHAASRYCYGSFIKGGSWTRPLCDEGTHSEHCSGKDKSPPKTKPQVTEASGEVDCEKCREILVERSKCWACETPFPLDKKGEPREHEIHELRLGPDIVRLVCGIARTAGDARNDYASKPKRACLQKALEKAHFCAGCGREDSEWDAKRHVNGQLCGKCIEKLERAEALEEQLAKEAGGEVVRYEISGEIFPGIRHLPKKWTLEEKRSKACLGLARALAGVGRRYGDEGHGRPLFEGTSSHRGAWVELTEEQASGLRDAIELLVAYAKSCRRDGFEEGRSLLLAMASGKLTVDEINARQAGSEKDE